MQTYSRLLDVSSSLSEQDIILNHCGNMTGSTVFVAVGRMIVVVLCNERPRTVKTVRSFLSFANYYRQFIKGFSDIVLPLTQLTKKRVAFDWTAEVEQAFQALKQVFMCAPVLCQFNPEAKTTLEADSSGCAIGGVLSPEDQSSQLHPIAFFSKKNLPAKCNYDIGDKEMPAIIRCLEEWKAELRSVPQFTILTDHQNLKSFMTKKEADRTADWVGPVPG
jgi:hypothetical protein